jgi:hypothetical protein
MSSVKNHVVSCCSLCLLLLLTLLTACSTSSLAPSPPAAQKTTPALSPTITGTTALGRKNCQPASPIDNASAGPEVQGTATHAELWALLQSTSGVPPRANSQVKIVWRMTGSGDFTIVAFGPSGMKVPPSQGPSAHLGSSWNRPGDEWGSVFTFPVAGCWDLHATRGNAFGDVWLKIVD